MLNTPALSVAQMKAGQIKVYAVTAKNRIAMAPDVPTTDEAGLPGFYFTFWHALWAPKGTPKEIVAKLNGALRTALANPSTRKKLIDLAQEIFPPDEQIAGGLAQIPAGRDRQVVADHQGGRHQGAVIRAARAASDTQGRASLVAGRQTRSRFSIRLTSVSITITKAASTNMPANTPATSNTPSACWIR